MTDWTHEYDMLSFNQAVAGPPSANQAAWYRFNLDITLNGSDVSQWDDQSGNDRHLIQATASKQPFKEADGSITFDGTDEFLKAVAFTLVQPETVYILCKYITWGNNEGICDGNAGLSGTIILAIAEDAVALYAGSFTDINSDFIINTYAALAAVFQSGDESLQVNKETPTAGEAGSGDMSGFTLGARGGDDHFSNIQVKEVILYSVAHDSDTRDSVVDYLNGL